ncbi:hypothetical protein ACFQUU_00695 [Herbaspirillum sp. GCM10030257]|uniref:hypothetical protein n=1 Tax=Herbaspirillum sp. GCM10030257 TaxID=3273393 RepID=UPI00360AA9CD
MNQTGGAKTVTEYFLVIRIVYLWMRLWRGIKALGCVALREGAYYVARANALESNVSLYYTVDGVRKTIKYVDAPVTPHVWHALRMSYKGNSIQVSLNGKAYIDTRDSHISGPGKVGVWTKAHSVTVFDDFTHNALRAVNDSNNHLLCRTSAFGDGDGPRQESFSEASNARLINASFDPITPIGFCLIEPAID